MSNFGLIRLKLHGFLGFNPVTSFQPLIDSGKELRDRLEKGATIGWNSLPTKEHVTTFELDTWYSNCWRFIQETFGKDSDEAKSWSSSLNEFDRIQGNQIREGRSDFVRLGEERIVCAIGILRQLEAQRLATQIRSTVLEHSKEAEQLNELIKQIKMIPAPNINIVSARDITGSTIVQSVRTDVQLQVSQLFDSAYRAVESENELSAAAKGEIRELVKSLQDELSRPTVDRGRVRGILSSLKQNAGWLVPVVGEILKAWLGL